MIELAIETALLAFIIYGFAYIIRAELRDNAQRKQIAINKKWRKENDKYYNKHWTNSL